MSNTAIVDINVAKIVPTIFRGNQARPIWEFQIEPGKPWNCPWTGFNYTLIQDRDDNEQVPPWSAPGTYRVEVALGKLKNNKTGENVWDYYINLVDFDVKKPETGIDVLLNGNGNGHTQPQDDYLAPPPPPDEDQFLLDSQGFEDVPPVSNKASNLVVLDPTQLQIITSVVVKIAGDRTNQILNSHIAAGTLDKFSPKEMIKLDDYFTNSLLKSAVTAMVNHRKEEMGVE